MAKPNEKGARIHVARGACKWGIGFTALQALQAAQAEKGDEFVVHKIPEEGHGPWVDGLGNLRWTGGGGDADHRADEIGTFTARSARTFKQKKAA